ncbi:CubicO group peptidase (beta-lactamase class C family) [Catenulispora sp. MAP12-49]|uniref:serine hydrolase domain-containing protein n=1 Tax=Catenulispora sp. MAP12-49 TaxID=3156302 RepID=UPI003514C01F
MTDTDLDGLLPELVALLDTATRENHVPGAAVAVSDGDQVIELATGVLNLNTGVAATPDSLFQIGSITKTLTATLTMQLVEAGLVDLDEPARTYVPELTVSDPAAAESVTVRQLLSHTSGLPGDVFTDFGRGDDAVLRYVEGLKDHDQMYEPGRMFSYCNAAYSVLGLLVQRIRELPSWEAALREHLIAPLGLTHMAALPEEALLFRTAVGHLDGPDGGQQVAPIWQLPRSAAPAGASTAARARDLIAFARAHMNGGLAQDGTRILSEASVAAMREQQVALPGSGNLLGTGWGLGFALIDRPGGLVVGHDGGTIGQTSRLRFAPDKGVAFSVLTNGGDALPVFEAVERAVFGALAGIEAQSRDVPPQPAVPIEAEPFLGSYADAGQRVDIVRSHDGGLQAVLTPLGAIAALTGPDPQYKPLVGYTPSSLLDAEPERGRYLEYAVPEVDEQGRATHLFLGGRIHTRMSDADALRYPLLENRPDVRPTVDHSPPADVDLG